VAFHVVKGVAPPPPPAAPSSGRGRNAAVRVAAAQTPQGLYLSGILPGR
jgi:hypothetical protein